MAAKISKDNSNIVNESLSLLNSFRKRPLNLDAAESPQSRKV